MSISAFVAFVVGVVAFALLGLAVLVWLEVAEHQRVARRSARLDPTTAWAEDGQARADRESQP